MIHIDLFAGIGGFSIAAQRMRWRTLVTCEIDEFCRKVLQYHFPDTYHHKDIKTLTYETINTELSKRYGSHWRNDDIIVTGGFPCQPFSVAGKRKGTNDDRHLWPEMLRVIREASPCCVVAENVSGLISQQSGMAFETVLADLENEGYEVQPFIIPACSIGAPHRRDRVWIIAHAANSKGERHESLAYRPGIVYAPAEQGIYGRDRNKRIFTDTENGGETVTDAERAGLQRCIGRFIQSCDITGLHQIPNWLDFPTQSPVCNRNDGLSGELAGITFSRWRRESLKALGNSVVPVLVYEIFKIIEQAEYISNNNK